jgi:hypothetical protein
MPRRSDVDMLATAAWFHPADRALMRFYGGHRDGEFFCGPGAAGLSISISEKHAQRRCRTLAAAGLLDSRGNSYRLTETGWRYVRGEMNSDELAALNPND